jgi:tight adherence protein B
MLQNEPWLVYALVFGAVLLGIQGFYWSVFASRKRRQIINRRLLLTAEINAPAEVLKVLRKERGLEIAEHVPLLKSLSYLIVQSGLRMTGVKWIIITIIPVILGYFLFKFASQSNLLAVLLAVISSIAFLYLFFWSARRRRIKAFSQQLPDALELVARSLRVGHPFRVAVSLVATRMPDPIGTEFGIVADEIMFGLEQSAAVNNIIRRVGQEDLLFFSTAVNIQTQTGGSLGEILSRLSKLLRARAKLRLKVRALSAEGRFSAFGMTLIPFVLFLVINLIDRQYFLADAVKASPLTPVAVVVGLTMLLIGNIILYRMVNFKI